ncbi:MAG: ATPase, partial [Candidatus Dormibacteraeota bacterium]|nr:ATPase [Candidatus Dormibacteraeota bacterium]
GNDTTRVELVHSELERHGADWAKVRDGVGSPGGWPGIMAKYAEAATA